MSISSDLNRKVNFGMVNRPDGLFLSISGKKYYFMKGSSICDLMRSIILMAEKEVEITIQAREISPDFRYTKTSENNIKKTFTAKSMVLKEDINLLSHNKSEDEVINDSDEEEKFSVLPKKPKKVGHHLYMPINLSKELKKCIVGEYESLPKKEENKSIVELDNEKPKDKVVAAPENKSISSVKKANSNKPNINVKTITSVKKELVKSDNISNIDNVKTTGNDIIIDGVKITDKHIKVFNEIKLVCEKLGIAELTRDEARKYGIKYACINNGRWGIIRQQYQEYNKKYMQS